MAAHHELQVCHPVYSRAVLPVGFASLIQSVCLLRLKVSDGYSSYRPCADAITSAQAAAGL